MVAVEDFGDFETAWCPGCGNFAILKAVKRALASLDLAPHQVLFVSGIGQAAKAPHYLNANVFNGLHGRSLPVATGAKLANPALAVIAESGDGCVYGSGGNHLLAAARRNVDISVLVHNNHVYALTKGQASPTTPEEGIFLIRPQPESASTSPFNPLSVAVAAGASYVARGFTGDLELLSELIQRAIMHKGFSLVDILQPCVSFNKTQVFQWYRERCYRLPNDYDPSDRVAALAVAEQWGDRIPLGIFYETERPRFEDHFHALEQGPLALQRTDLGKLNQVMQSYV